MKNTDLKEFYNKVYLKGERSHYTKLLLSKKTISQEKAEILAEIPWEGKEVLDIGCGTGELAYYIARASAKKVIGIDYSDAAVRLAQKTYIHPNLSFECGDTSSIKGTFDVITIVGVLEHIDKPFQLLKRLQRFLKPGGSIIVTCPNWSNARGYMLLLLKELFGAQITLVDIHYFTPIEFEAWAKKLSMDLTWKTIEHEWGHGSKMITDFKKRFPPVLASIGVKTKKSSIASFIKWLDAHLPALETNQKAGGAVGFYHFIKK